MDMVPLTLADPVTFSALPSHTPRLPLPDWLKLPAMLAGVVAPLRKAPLLVTLPANAPLAHTVAPLAMARFDRSPLRTSSPPALTWVAPVKRPASVRVRVPL